MARTQKNKNTAYHLGTLKAKLAKLRRELLTPKGGSGGASEGGKSVVLYHITYFYQSVSMSLKLVWLESVLLAFLPWASPRL